MSCKPPPAEEAFDAIFSGTIDPKVGLKRRTVKNAIKQEVRNLCLLPSGLKLKLRETDPTYSLRYGKVCELWTDETEEEAEKLDAGKLDELFKKVKNMLSDKESLYIERSDEPDINNYTEDDSSRGNTYHISNDSHEVIGYVTTIGVTKLFVKPEDKTSEIEVSHREVPYQFSLVKPGDKIKVVVSSGSERYGKNLDILEISDIQDGDRDEFVSSFTRELTPVECDELRIYLMFARCKGIWNYIKADESLKDNGEMILKTVKLCFLLSRNLPQSFCKDFLADFSSSHIFGVLLPQYIDTTVQQFDCDDVNLIEDLLTLISQMSPQSADRVLTVAHSLAGKVVKDAAQDEEKKDGIWAIDLCIKLGKILAEAIPSVKTEQSTWYNFPAIATHNEIFCESDLAKLESIKETGSYETTDKYLEINYKLLREECYRNLKTGIRNFTLSQQDDRKQIKIYRVQLKGIFQTQLEISIALSYEIYGADKPEDNMQENETLLYGNLMCISLDETFKKPIWATVGRFPKECSRDSKTKLVYIKLCSKECENVDDAEFLIELQRLTDRGDFALMAESPTFFQAFGPSMDRLIEAKKSGIVRNKGNMPFMEEIVLAQKSRPPDYVKDEKISCDWGIIFDKPEKLQFPVQDGGQHSPLETFKFLKDEGIKSQLDGAQLIAVEQFLNNRITLIQGPPGTGKSFLGAKIVQLMLSMKIHERYKGPILVMTYKNFALDNFLESCLEYCPNVVRIGRSSENSSEKLKERNLRCVSAGKRMEPHLHAGYVSLRRKMAELRPRIKASFQAIQKPKFTVEFFLQTAQPRHIRSLLIGCSELSQSDKDNVDGLLSNYKGDPLGMHCDSALSEMVRKSLLKWLPLEDLREKYSSYLEREKEIGREVKINKRIDSKNSMEGTSEGKIQSTVPKSEEENSYGELDPSLIAQERLQDADDQEEEEVDDGSCKLDDADLEKNEHIEVPLAHITSKDGEFYNFDLYERTNDLWKDLQTKEERVQFVYALQGETLRRFTKWTEEYKKNCDKYKDVSEKHDAEVLKEAGIVGMTITGAAMRSNLLKLAKPCAVIVEEAAEIIEGQLISVLPTGIRHLVMLGDQMQLKPHISCYELKKKKLHCSMFERLIKNKLECKQLETQFRMKEDIAQLLDRLGLYKNLKTDSEKTCNNHPPKCIGKHMFFWRHTNPESSSPGTNSKHNIGEIRKITDVAAHLVTHDYPPEDITVLCAYRDQMVKMKRNFEEKARDPVHKLLPRLKDVEITTIDSYQGRENNVILLSLVRSRQITGRAEPQIGFLNESNRICVAVSRAKCGLYFFGNDYVYETKSRRYWKKIIDLLTERGLIDGKFQMEDISEKEEARKDSTRRNINVVIHNPMGPVQVGDNTTMHYGQGSADIEDEDQGQDRGVVQRLSQSSIQMIASKIPTKWDRLARLLNIEESVIEEIHQLKCDAVSKAVKLLQKYRSSSTFDKSDLRHWLQWLDIRLPEDVLPSESNNSERSEDGETVQNTTSLSPRERERLSLPIVNLWKRLAGLLNITEEEVSNISLSNPDAEERQKAARMLALYNEKSYFSREDLGKYLGEVECPILKEQVLSGILRKR